MANPFTARVRGLAPPPTVPQRRVVDWNVPALREAFSGPKGRPAVTDTPELQRVLALPKREPIKPGSAMALAVMGLMNERLGWYNPSCQCAALGEDCIRELSPVQAWALYEMALTGGLLGPIGVGHGKTGLDLLSPMVMPDCKLAVVLIPPSLQGQLLRMWNLWAQHFKVPSLVLGKQSKFIPGRPVLHVVPYSIFSRPDSTDLLERLLPDLIEADECHRLKHRDTATTGRFLRYFVNHPDTRFCGWSGTITDKSIKDYAHLSALSLREGSPLPLHPNVVEEWALAIDPPQSATVFRAPRGALEKLCENPREDLYKAFSRRVRMTRGVVGTEENTIKASIVISERKAPPVPATVTAALNKLRAGWMRPDGEELVEILQVAKCARELACGFYYRWKFPHGEPERLILDWLDVRKEWHRELREKLKSRVEHMDSPLLCAKAAIRYYQTDPPYLGELPVWKAEMWPDWVEIRGKVRPEPDTVWVDDYLARDAAEWAKHNKGIVWYEHDAFGQMVAKISGLPLHGGGPNAGEILARETGKHSIIASIKSHGEGRDGLQKLFYKQLIANPPSSGKTWEQVLGRTHRPGQKADEVEVEAYLHTDEMREALEKAKEYARYIQGTMGTKQKLLMADYTF